MFAYSERILVLPPGAAAPVLGRSFSRTPRRGDPAVYFAIAGNGLKVGKASRPAERIGGLSNDALSTLAWLTAGFPVERMIVLEGTDSAHERELHRRFEPEALVREWYPRNGLVGGLYDQLAIIADAIGAPIQRKGRPSRTERRAV